MLDRRVSVLLLLVLGACSDTYYQNSFSLGEPTDLSYQLIPSGDPAVPDGVLLRWTDANDDRVTDYVVYSRPSTGASWDRRGATTSNTFHDAGVPNLQYYVTSEDIDGRESRASNVITIDERNRLPAPSDLISVSLDRAIQLSWPSNARVYDPGLFDYYRVYSTPYDLDLNLCDDQSWALEGTTVSEDFLSTGLPNGVPRCFAVSTVSRDGHESVWSPARADTPRYDARNVYVDAYQAAPATSGFRFFDPSTQAFGLVTSGSRTDLDFRIDQRQDGSLWFTPIRGDVKIALYSTSPVTDLTSIDVAPVRSAFSGTAIEAVPGYAYVFEMQLADGLHYGAIRVTHTGADYLIFDWAYQTDPGNPELQRIRGVASHF
jgi:hypothetical protein